MKEARIEVREEGDDFRVRLLDVSNDENELASGLTDGTALSVGFTDPEITFKGQLLNSAALLQDFQNNKKTLSNREVFGAYLYRLLTPELVGDKWEALTAKYSVPDDEHLAVLLDLPDSWQSLPWELTHHNGIHLCHNKRHSLGLRIPGGREIPSSCSWPLRVLVVVGCKKQDDIKWQEECEAIRAACCAFSLRFDLTILGPGKTQPEVEKEIDQVRPHIFHFIGHGTASGNGALVLGDDKWKRDEIQAALTAHAPPRIAVINACQSAGEQGDLVVGSTANAFARIGSPAVIAMRGDIVGTAAATLAGTFYRELAEVGVNRLDQAFCRAVRDVSTKEDIDNCVWAFPRIYYQTTVSDVFPLAGECRGFEKAAKHDDELQEIKTFVNCIPQRFQMYQNSDAWLDDPDPANRLLLITGESQVGKSWLLKALTYVASLRDYHTLYWKFPENENHDLARFLDTLRNRRSGRSCFRKSLSSANLQPEHFKNFNELCQADDTSSRRGNEDPYTPIIAAFADGLNQVAESTSTILAFDHIHKFDDTQWNEYIVKPLVEPVSVGDMHGNLRIAIAASDAELESHGLKSLRAKKLNLDRLPPDEFFELALDYYHLQDDGKTPDKEKNAIVRTALQAIAELHKDKPWKLGDLPGRVGFMGGR